MPYNYVLHAVERARAANTKTAVIVSGGPGSGKSVIALSLLGELSRQGRTVLHATGSRSFTHTLRKVAGARAPRVQKMFQYFNSFMAAEPNDLDALILDEAHRIRETSVSRWTRAEHRTGRPQIEELLAAARVPVFLLDEFQVVRPGEQGTVEDIAEHAAALGLAVERIHLDAQFRCGGSQEYVLWVKRLLDLEPGGPIPWIGDPHFEVQVVDSPAEMEAHLEAKLADGYSARMAAGYCWPWSDPRPDGTLVPDVQLGDWRRPWNLKGDRSVGGAPAAALWATDPAGFGQVGCVYTAQGFEYDYAGVILGPGPGLARRPLGGPPRGQQGPGLPQPHQGQRPGVRPPGPQRLQGAADARHARRRHLLARRGVTRIPPRAAFTPDLRAGHLAPDSAKQPTRTARQASATGHATRKTREGACPYDELDRHHRKRPGTPLGCRSARRSLGSGQSVQARYPSRGPHLLLALRHRLRRARRGDQRPQPLHGGRRAVGRRGQGRYAFRLRLRVLPSTRIREVEWKRDVQSQHLNRCGTQRRATQGRQTGRRTMAGATLRGPGRRSLLSDLAVEYEIPAPLDELEIDADRDERRRAEASIALRRGQPGFRRGTVCAPTTRPVQ